MKKIIVLTREKHVNFFRLVGISEVHAVRSPMDAIRTFRKTVEREDVSLLIVTEDVAEWIANEIKKWVSEQRKAPYPLIIPEPPFLREKLERIDPIVEAIFEKTGYRIKL